MDSFQDRRFAGGGGGGDLQQQHQPQQNPFPNPYHHPPQSHPLQAASYPYHHPPPPHHHYPSPPPPISSQHQQPPPPPPPHHHHHPHPHQQQQQPWVHPDGHLQPQLQPQHHHHPPLPPPYPQPMPPYAAQPMQHHHHQYPQQHPLPAPHHGPPLPPAAPSAYAPPAHQGWGGMSWPQHQGWEYPERNLGYNNEDDWAARAKAWAAAKSASDNHQTAQVVPDGRMEAHNYTYHDQYQATLGPSDTQQPLLSQTTNQQQLPHYPLDQQKQVNHLHGSATFSSGLTSYAADTRLHYNAGEEAAPPHKDHNSPAKSLGPTSSIYEQEVPYSYSSVPGNRDAVNQFPLPALSAQEGVVHPQPALTDQNVAVHQSDFTHGTQPSDYMPDASNKPLDFKPRPASNLEPHINVSYGPSGPSQSMGMMGHDAVSISVNAWNPTAPGGFPQLDPSFVPQPALCPHPSVYGRLPGPNFRPGVSPTAPPFGLVAGASLNQATIMPADASAVFNLPERPKKAAVPNWLREEIIKNKSVIVSTYAGHQSGSSYNSIGSEDDDKSYRKADQADNKSVDSTKSTDNEEDDEDDTQAARSAAVNQEIKRILTEVLLKVTDELFDEIATKVLNEDDPTDEVYEHKELESHKDSCPAGPAPKGSTNALATVTENKINGVSERSGLQSAGGDILGLASYASDDEEDDVEMQNSRDLIHGSNGRPSANELKSIMNENILVNQGEPAKGPDGGGSERLDPDDASKKSNARTHTVKSLHIDASVSDGKSHNHRNEHKDFSEKKPHLPSKGRLASGSDDSDALMLKEKISKGGVKIDKMSGNYKAGESEDTRDHARGFKNNNISERYPEKRSYFKESVKKESTVADKSTSETSDSTETISHEDKIKLKENVDRRNNAKETSEERRGAKARDFDSRSHGSTKGHKVGITKDKNERDRGDSERKKEKLKDEKEDNSRRVTKESRHSNRRSPSPSHRGRNSKESSSHGRGSISSDEPLDIPKRRRLQSRSPSPTRSRARQVSRSPHRKHSHRRHSPYSSDRRRSRSGSPVQRRR